MAYEHSEVPISGPAATRFPRTLARLGAPAVNCVRSPDSWSCTTTAFPVEAGAERHTAAGRSNPAVPRDLAEVPRELAEVPQVLAALRQAQAPAEARQVRAIAGVRQVLAALRQAQAASRRERVSPRFEWRCTSPPGRPFPSPRTACVR